MLIQFQPFLKKSPRFMLCILKKRVSMGRLEYDSRAYRRGIRPAHRFTIDVGALPPVLML